MKIDHLRNKNRTTRRQLGRVLQQLGGESDESGSSSPLQVPTTPLQTATSSSARILWNQMTPRTKAKMRQRLSDYPDSSPETVSLLRKEGIRLDRVTSPTATVNSLQLKVTEFIHRDDNSLKCPDKKKEHLRYRLNNLSVLHEQFLSENLGLQCS